MKTRGQLIRLAAYVRPYAGRVLCSLVAASVAAGAAAFYAFVVGPLLKAVLTGAAVSIGRWSLSGHDLIIRLPLLICGVAVIKAIAQTLQGGLMQSVSQDVMRDVRRDLYERLLHLPPRFVDDRHSGELLSRFSSDVAQVEFTVGQALTSYVKDTLQVLALLGTCWLIDRRLFLLAFVVLPGAIIPVGRFARSLKQVARKTQASLGRLTELAAEQLHALPVVQGFNSQPKAEERFDREQQEYLRAMDRSLFIRGAFTPTLEVLGILGVALAIGFGAKAIQNEPALATKLLSFLAAALLMYQPLKALSGTFALAVQGLGAATRLFEILDEQPPREPSGEVGPLVESLELKRVSLAYVEGRDVLRELSCTLRAGQKVALVGASGSGKSTLAATLLRFVEPSSGTVLWDGADLRTCSRRSVRVQMAWVPQEPVLFSGSVRDNLLLAASESGEAELWSALERAHAAGFVRSFARGIDEPVGERGSRLSGGQRQRLAIARALLRNPSLLILDEPTSALDAASENEVQAGLAELVRERTTLVIAHRLVTVRDADLILVLDEGRIVEQGKHAELVARRGRYAELLARGELAPAS